MPKKCPNCDQTYSDESLNFCFNDGSVLLPVQTVGSIPVSVDHSEGGGTSIQTIEQGSDGKRRLIVADAFPREPKAPPRQSKILPIVIAAGLLAALIGALLLWFTLR